mgnify:CR=1 FL=1
MKEGDYMSKVDNKHYCIFEDKICPYANKKGPAFECTAPSDDEMPCRA